MRLFLYALNPPLPTGGFIVPSFHNGQSDYLELPRGESSEDWHDGLNHVVFDDPTLFGSWQETGIVDLDILATDCPLYSPLISTGGGLCFPPLACPASGSSFATPPRRAGDYVHEGFHSFRQEHNINVNHFVMGNKGVVGNCNKPSCNYFYAHTKDAFGPGGVRFGTDPSDIAHYHSTYQIQTEFECDIADSSNLALPMSVLQASSSEVNAHLNTQFINGMPFACGIGLPLGAGATPGKAGLTSICAKNTDCKSACCAGGRCGPPGSFCVGSIGAPCSVDSDCTSGCCPVASPRVCTPSGSCIK